MKKNQYISIFIIVFIFSVFSLTNVFKTKKYSVIKVVNPFEVYIDYNKNGTADDSEKFVIKNEFQIISKDNVGDKCWQSLNLDDDVIYSFIYLTEKHANNVILDKKVKIKRYKNSGELYISNEKYTDILAKSGFLFKNGKPVNMTAYNARIKQIKKNEYKIYNTKSNKYHLPSCKYGNAAHNYVILSKYQIPKGAKPCKFCMGTKGKSSYKHKHHEKNRVATPKLTISDKNIKLILADYTTHLYPSRNTNNEICNELINHINSAKNSIDVAIYGYDKVPKIEKALMRAIGRGVKVRLVYDKDSNGNNIYKDTKYFSKLIGNAVSDGDNSEAKKNNIYVNSIMHDKFYVFDNSTVITGSANLSYTDMSDYNGNAVVIINSKAIANAYTKEFEQMYSGRFHNRKSKNSGKENISVGDSNISVFFSPQDLITTTQIIPMIHKSRKYVYMPVFLITDNRLVQSLIAAKKRGVDVKLIVDATNAKNSHSAHKLLRANNIPVKTETFAGKLHSKSIIIDDKYLIVGSMNFSKSGEKKNDENVLIITNSKLTIFYKNYFNYLWAKINNYWLSHDVSAESYYSAGSCSDGIDNDYDGLTDKDDEGCKFKPKKKFK